MKILLVDLGRERRGGQKQTLLIASALAARGHEIAVAARGGSPLAEDLVKKPPFVRVFPVRGRGELDPRALLDVAAAARRFGPEVLYAQDAHGLGAAVWSGCARGRRLVAHRRVAVPPRGGWLGRLKYRAAARVLAVSGAVARSLIQAGVPASRISIVPDGIPDGAFIARDAPQPPPLRLLHAGAFDGKKGQQTVIRAVAELSRCGVEVTATLLGDGPERPAVEKLARSLGLGGLCAFPGYVEGIQAELARAHFFVLPSETEGSSTALLEAMAAGCPVIVHDTGGAGEMVREAGSGLALSELDPVAWARAVEEAAASSEAIARWVEAGRRFAETRRICRIVEQLERELCGESRPL